MLYHAATSDIRTSPGAPRTAMQARDRVRALLESSATVRVGTAGGEALLTDALLVTSELVTNAIRHGGGLLGFDASLCAGGTGLRIAVTDALSTRSPVPAGPSGRCGDGPRRLRVAVDPPPHAEHADHPRSARRQTHRGRRPAGRRGRLPGRSPTGVTPRPL